MSSNWMLQGIKDQVLSLLLTKSNWIPNCGREIEEFQEKIDQVQRHMDFLAKMYTQSVEQRTKLEETNQALLAEVETLRGRNG